MSQSPESTRDRTGVQQYGQSWADTLRLVRAGSSWSGRERNCVYLNVGANTDALDKTNQRFANVSAVSGFDFPDDARSLALLDWDHDGDLDLWVRNRTAPRVRFLQNQTAQQTGNQAISIELQATAGNRHAIGAVVTLQTESDTRPQMQSVRCGDAFLSQSTGRLHFGFRQPVSNATAQVLWPGGKRETFAGLRSGQAVRLVQGTGQPELVQRSVSKIIAASTPEPLPETSAARIILPAKLAFPNIDWLDENAVATDNPVENTNRVHSNQASSNRGTLVTLWTSSCVVCRQELARFDAANDELEKGWAASDRG
ncbi:MAG: ASPIC/UnbV domain-containing protein [Pirellulaceae bacterium]